MPRQARIDAPGALHHIIVRGIERKTIFRDEQDQENFLKRLGVIVTDSVTACYAWSLMKNHAHLLLMTGTVPIATVMRRLLTGYAQDFNRRHNRHGQLFQNRYKSILCEEDQYLLELVRYIHLNPVRARTVKDMDALRNNSCSGHAVLMDERKCEWQSCEYVLRFFGKRSGAARKKYESFVTEGLYQGRRRELVGGGLIRSIGGWKALKQHRLQGTRIKGDERILGSSDFVAEVLRQAEEELVQGDRLKSYGITFERVLSEVADYYKLDVEELTSGARQRVVAEARAVICYIAVRRLHMSCKKTSQRLHISPSAVSNVIRKGRPYRKY